MINQVHQADCIDFMKTMTPESVDLVVTDPPYTIEYSSYRTKSGLIAGDNTKKWIKPFFEEL
jgi:site-specific DNA-methyltransferase (adenine-specific)